MKFSGVIHECVTSCRQVRPSSTATDAVSSAFSEEFHFTSVRPQVTYQYSCVCPLEQGASQSQNDLQERCRQ